MEFRKEMTLAEILDQPCFAQMEGQFISCAAGDWFRRNANSHWNSSKSRIPPGTARISSMVLTACRRSQRVEISMSIRSGTARI